MYIWKNELFPLKAPEGENSKGKKNGVTTKRLAWLDLPVLPSPARPAPVGQPSRPGLAGLAKPAGTGRLVLAGLGAAAGPRGPAGRPRHAGGMIWFVRPVLMGPSLGPYPWVLALGYNGLIPWALMGPSLGP